MSDNEIKQACESFKALITEQLARVENLQKPQSIEKLSEKNKLIIGVCWGDGIGPAICEQAQWIFKEIIKNSSREQVIEFEIIDDLTIENRAQKHQAIPDTSLEKLKKCDIILKGPTTTPQAGDDWPNIESANVAMRRELDLFACVRPIKIPKDSIDWCIFRENTEGAYTLGSKGFDVSNDLSIDFKICSEQGAERICRMAFEYAKDNKKKKVTVVTKSNVVKTTDGRFSKVAKRVAKEYESYGITCDEWYIDIMTAKILDPSRRSEFEVMVMPNLYGDILSDEAGQLQGGVGTAGSANIGSKYAMFEAIHGSAPRMVKEGRSQYADPSSMIKATAMCLKHIGWINEGNKLDMALEICGQFEQKLKITGRESGSTNSEYSEYILETYLDPNIQQRYEKYTSK